MEFYENIEMKDDIISKDILETCNELLLPISDDYGNKNNKGGYKIYSRDGIIMISSTSRYNTINYKEFIDDFTSLIDFLKTHDIHLMSYIKDGEYTYHSYLIDGLGDKIKYSIVYYILYGVKLKNEYNWIEKFQLFFSKDDDNKNKVPMFSKQERENKEKIGKKFKKYLKMKEDGEDVDIENFNFYENNIYNMRYLKLFESYIKPNWQKDIDNVQRIIYTAEEYLLSLSDDGLEYEFYPTKAGLKFKTDGKKDINYLNYIDDINAFANFICSENYKIGDNSIIFIKKNGSLKVLKIQNIEHFNLINKNTIDGDIYQIILNFIDEL